MERAARGQRQALAISRSIDWKAKILIMDEPTADLGIAEQRKVLSLVRARKKQGLGIIIMSHQMYDVFEVADRLAVLRRGVKVGERLIKETTPDEVVGLIVGAETVAAGEARTEGSAHRLRGGDGARERGPGSLRSPDRPMCEGFPASSEIGAGPEEPRTLSSGPLGRPSELGEQRGFSPAPSPGSRSRASCSTRPPSTASG